MTPTAMRALLRARVHTGIPARSDRPGVAICGVTARRWPLIVIPLRLEGHPSMDCRRCRAKLRELAR